MGFKKNNFRDDSARKLLIFKQMHKLIITNNSFYYVYTLQYLR